MAGMYGCFKSRNSDSAAMASGPPDAMANQEPAEAGEECSGKKKSKFQTFKKFFARKKRKEPPAAGADAGLKASQSSDNVSKASENNTLTRSEKEKGSGSKISLGSKALSHDSVFVSDSSEANDALGASQDSIHGKVKSLQNQLKQAIRLGSPPSLICVKKAEDAGAMSEDDGLPCSPPEYTALHAVMNQAQRNSSVSLEGMDSDDDQLSCAASSRAVSPLVVPGDFSQPASPFGCLDNSAAKHKLGLRNKACNRRKPASRLELRPERDSVVEEVKKTLITESLEEKLQKKTTEGVSNDELKEKVKREEDREEEERKEEERPQRSSLQESEDGEVEADAAQDVSHGADTSCPEPSRLEEEEEEEEEENPQGRPPPSSSSKSSSRASSLHSPSASPEPPAGPREYLLDPPGTAYGVADNAAESDSALRGGQEEDVAIESKEEESSLLQEVLSSLKTPLASCSLDAETVGAEVEAEHEVVAREDEEAEEGEQSMERAAEEEEEEEDPVIHQAPSVASPLTTEEEEEEGEEIIAPSSSAPLCQDVEEKEKTEVVEVEATAAEEEEEDEEEQVVEQLSPCGQKEEEDEEEAVEVEAEEQGGTFEVNQAEEEARAVEEESEGEEEAIELEKEAEVEEEGREKREVEDEDVEVEEVKERLDEAEEALEEEGDNADEMTEVSPGAASEEAEDTDEGVDVEVGDEMAASTLQQEDEVPTEVHHEVCAAEEREDEDEEERVEEAIEVDHTEGEAEQPDGDVENPHSDMEQEGEATEQAHISPEPPSLSPPESQHSGTSAPSKPSTTTLHINLHSPSSEKAPAFFKPKESETPSEAVADTEEEQDEPVEAEEEEEEEENQESPPPASVEEVLQQSSRDMEQSKARFTIAPAWQRSVSEEEPREEAPLACSPPAEPEVEAEAAGKKEPEVRAEPASPSKVELVLSPGRARTAGPTAAKPASSATSPPPANKPQSAAAASAEESSVVVEGNPDNPFGVRLRKTSVLHRFSSEEESTESPAEPQPQPATGGKADSPQPISTKPSISQPISSKPALPKKPDVHGDGAGKSKRVSEPPAARGVSSGSESPSWISMAKQKQKIYKENSLEEITVKKEEQERKTSLPMYVSSAVSREHSNKAAEPAGKVSPVEITKPSVSVEKESRRSLSPPTPVPAQPPKSQTLPCPVPPKPQPPPAATKPSPQRSLSPPTPVPVPQKSTPASCTSPPALSKTAPSPQPTAVTSPPFSSRTAPEKPAPRPPGLSGPSPAPQRGLAPQALPQDEPPWMALAKKKAKAWSEMPQIVQ